jgi:hypothetical protein
MTIAPRPWDPCYPFSFSNMLAQNNPRDLRHESPGLAEGRSCAGRISMIVCPSQAGFSP